MFAKFIVMIPNLNNLKRPVVTALFLFFLAGAAKAHDPGLSAIRVRLRSAEIDVQLSFASNDLENALKSNGRGVQEILRDPMLEAFGQDALELKIDDRPLSMRSIETHADEFGSVIFQLVYDRNPGSDLRVVSHTLNLLSRGHRQYVSVVDEKGNKAGEKVLNASDCQLDVEVSSATQHSTLLQFVGLGVEHILAGYDHLVFLLGLLIVGAGFKDITKIISSFTAAHSVTLALSTLDVVHISPSFVEPLIAVSIIYVGLENILRRDLKRRWLLTFGFGLVHGFGFAAALRDVGIGSGSTAVIPLVSFNVGVELGQLSIAMVALPIIWRLRRRSVFVTRFAPACSAVIGIAGMAWLVERLLG